MVSERSFVYAPTQSSNYSREISMTVSELKAIQVKRGL